MACSSCGSTVYNASGACSSCGGDCGQPKVVVTAQGIQGDKGDPGRGYDATSATSTDVLDTAATSVTGVITTYKAYTPGARVRFSDTANPAVNYFEGIVNAYDPVTGAITVNNIDLKNGSGTIASWDVNLAGEQGSVGPGSSTDLGVANINANTIDVTSSTGNNTTLPAATASDAGVMTAADKTKLNGVASGANNYSHPNHSGEVTSVGDGATALDKTAISNKTLVTADAADHILIGDASDADNLKKATITSVVAAGGASYNHLISFNGTPIASAGAVDQPLANVNITAGTLSAQSGVKVTFFGKFGNTANSKRIYVQFNGLNAVDSIIDTAGGWNPGVTPSYDALDWSLTFEVFRIGASTTDFAFQSYLNIGSKVSPTQNRDFQLNYNNTDPTLIGPPVNANNFDTASNTVTLVTSGIAANDTVVLGYKTEKMFT